MNTSTTLGVALTLTAISCVAVTAPPARATGPSCGAVIVKSTTLRSDLKNCPADGLVIGADNLTLDLGGHTVDGTSAASTAGIRLAGHHGVTVARGTLREFGNAVLLDGADGNALLRVTATRSNGSGIALQSSDGNVVDHATSSGNVNSGIRVVAASRNRVIDGTVTGNHTGIELVDGSNGNRLTGNLITLNAQAAIVLDLSDENVVTGNRSAQNTSGISFNGNRNRIVGNLLTDSMGCADVGCGPGIDGSGGTGNLIASNVISGTMDEGVRFNEFEAVGGTPAIGNVIRNNIVRGAGTDGIALQTHTDEISGHGTVTDNLIEANLVIGSGQDGINVGRPANTVSRNVALRNGALGLEAVPGVIDGGGNHAFGNGDPRQCLQVACH